MMGGTSYCEGDDEGIRAKGNTWCVVVVLWFANA
jgi:hypothetical protein